MGMHVDMTAEVSSSWNYCAADFDGL